ncbi:Nn.00g087700.m01.CDS01 [Neocucurbitaria sp. VM-36]
MAPRGNNCPELPKFCTGHVMMHGEATTLIYLCPERTQGPSTVHVTVTATTTVTVVPTNGAPATPTKDNPPPDEPTTTTTIKSTLTQYKTITVISKPGISSVLSVTLPVITNSISEQVPPLSASSLTLTLPIANETASSIFSTHSDANSTTIAPTPFYPNTTYHSEHSGYGAPTLPSFNPVKEAKHTGMALAQAQALSKSKSGQIEVSFVALLVSLLAAAYFA